MTDYKRKVEILKRETGLNDRELLEMLADKYLKDNKKTGDEILGDWLRGQAE